MARRLGFVEENLRAICFEAVKAGLPGGSDGARVVVALEGFKRGLVVEEAVSLFEVELAGVELVEGGQDFDTQLGRVEDCRISDREADGFDGLAVVGVLVQVFGDRDGGGREGDAGDASGGKDSGNL